MNLTITAWEHIATGSYALVFAGDELTWGYPRSHLPILYLSSGNRLKFPELRGHVSPSMQSYLYSVLFHMFRSVSLYRISAGQS